MPSEEDFMSLMEPTQLYNILNESFQYPCLSDPNFLLLLDARNTNEYNESHVLTAKSVKKDTHGQYMLPYDSEVECKKYIVVYDGTTDSLENKESAALVLAKLLVESGSKNAVQVLCGGYERFSALYPFLRTQKILWLPQELDDIKTYPVEVIPGVLYMGNLEQATAPHVYKDLKIKGTVACVSNKPDSELQKSDNPAAFIHLPLSDNPDCALSEHLSTVCAFIDTHTDKKDAVLVYSELGYSRSAAVCIAYLMYKKRANVQVGYDALKQCNRTACPNTGFLDQLEKWYESTIGKVEATTGA